MAKKISVSLTSFVYEKTIGNNPGYNRSEWISELLLRGWEQYKIEKEKMPFTGINPLTLLLYKNVSFIS